MLELAARIHAEHGVAIAELDLGGGFGIAYTPDDDPPEVKTLTTGAARDRDRPVRGLRAARCRG